MSLILASAADVVKIWDVSPTCELDLKAQSQDHSQGTSHSHTALSWNHTHQVIASSINKPGKIMLIQSVNGQLLSHVPFSDSPEPVPGIYDSQYVKTLTFSNNSRYLACGIGPYVHLWDLKRRILRYDSSVTGITRGAITSMQFFTEANDIISGDSHGYIRLWNNKQTVLPAQTSAIEEFFYKDNVGVTCLQLPSLGSSKIASGYEDGSLIMWDPNHSNYIRSQKVHSQKLMALAFSPKNSRLVGTAGLDGTLALVDTAARTGAVTVPSASVQAGEPLHSITFHEDAIHTAVGTESGRIMFYDWRNVRKPVSIRDAHDSTPVAVLKFQAYSTFKSTTALTTSLKVPETPSTNALKNQTSVDVASIVKRIVPESEKPVNISTGFDSKISKAIVPSDSKNITSPTPSLPARAVTASVDGKVTGKLKQEGTPLKDNKIDKISPTRSPKSSLSSIPRMSSINAKPLASSQSNSQDKTVTGQMTYPESKPSDDIMNQGIYPQSNGKIIPSISMNQSINSQISPKNVPPISPKNEASGVSPPTIDQLRQQYGISTAPKPATEANTAPTVSSSSTDGKSSSVSPTLSHARPGIYYEDNPMHAAKQLTRSSSKNVSPVLDSSTSNVSQKNPMADKKPSQPIGSSFMPSSSLLSKSNGTDISSLANRMNNISPVKGIDYSLSNETKQSLAEPVSNKHISPQPDINSLTQSIQSSSNSTYRTPVKQNQRLSGVHQEAPAEFASIYNDAPDEFESLRKSVRPVTSQELNNAIELLKYDVHKEMKTIVKEVVRQFDISREETADQIRGLTAQLQELLEANKELREENERLRRIY